MTTSILVIAGSDSIGGAGIQMDVRVSAALGVHATCAVTAVTVQNTMGVDRVEAMDPDLVVAQIRAAKSDVPPNIVKIGMLASSEVAEAVADELKGIDVPVVYDPSLVATPEGNLAEDSLVETVKKKVFPLCDLITPSVTEAYRFTGLDPLGKNNHEELAGYLLTMGHFLVLIKGGYYKGKDCVDYLYQAHKCEDDPTAFYPEVVNENHMPRVEGEFHGTGSALSTAFSCYFAKGASLTMALNLAQNMVHGMIEHPLDAGNGSKILDPFWNRS